VEALRLNPKNMAVKKILDNFPQLPGGQPPTPQRATIAMDVYPSSVPHKLVQMRFDSSGLPIRDGIEVEFYDNGRLKHFMDIDQGVPNGLEISWDKEGRQISILEYRQGKAIDLRK
jgi:antitoxin component YwqK of YwqJK toxin-antitoxin module